MDRRPTLHSGVQFWHLEECFGMGKLAGFLEGLAEKQTSLFALLLRTCLLENSFHGLLDGVGFEGDIGQGYDDLPDLTVDKVGFAGVHPPAAGEDPGPTLHADGVLDVLVLEAEHLDPEPVGCYDFWLYAYGRRHGHSLTVENRPAVRELVLTLSLLRTCPHRGGKRCNASQGRRGGAGRPCSLARACQRLLRRGRARRWPCRRRELRRGRGRGGDRPGSLPPPATRRRSCRGGK